MTSSVQLCTDLMLKIALMQWRHLGQMHKLRRDRCSDAECAAIISQETFKLTHDFQQAVEARTTTQAEEIVTLQQKLSELRRQVNTSHNGRMQAERQR